MLEQMKSVSNPLTIIALFAALAEIAGTVAIKLVAPEMQPTFIWFVMIFPTLIVVLFFITLNFNAKVLYAPGDFKNEENYLAIQNAKQGLAIENVQTMIAEAKTEIISDVMKTVSTNGAGDRNRVEEIVNQKLQPVQAAVEDIKGAAYSWAENFVDNIKTATSRIRKTLNNATKPLTITEIVSESQTDPKTTQIILSVFSEKGIVKLVIDEDGTTKFVITKPRHQTTKFYSASE